MNKQYLFELKENVRQLWFSLNDLTKQLDSDSEFSKHTESIRQLYNSLNELSKEFCRECTYPVHMPQKSDNVYDDEDGFGEYGWVNVPTGWDMSLCPANDVYSSQEMEFEYNDGYTSYGKFSDYMESLSWNQNAKMHITRFRKVKDYM